MNNKIITAVSFLYEGERHIVKCTTTGKFRVPVTEVIEGRVRTKNKSLTAKQLLEHDVIKKCDPTFYLQDGRKHRVFYGGDATYLPAESEGLAEKHDEANKPRKVPKLKFGKTVDKSKTNGYNLTKDWKQETLDMYGCWPYDEDYHD